MTDLSVAIITRNEADNIAACVGSVAFADDIVVVDSGSSDQTVAIATGLGCRVFHNPWPGFARQKQFAVDRCLHDWVLVLDADERIPHETAEAVTGLLGSADVQAVGMSLLRKNYFHGRWMRRCGWWPDRVLRVVNRKKGRFSDHAVHESWQTDGPVIDLNLAIDHTSFRCYSDLVDKMERYSSLAAAEKFAAGETAAWWTPIAHGLWMFIQCYGIKGGILAGFDGFMISLFNAQGSFMKYAKLRERRLHGDIGS
jgi:(heptosyl)LPS beta-1,4-glucosyltransferase